MTAHQIALRLVNNKPFILVAAHLYNSFRQTNPESRRWEDMEQIISMHGTSKLLVGDRSITLHDISSRCTLACGLPASFISGSSRRQVLRNSEIGNHRKLDMLAPDLSTFKERFCEGVGRCDLGPSDAIAILGKNGPRRSVPVPKSREIADPSSVLVDFRPIVQKEVTAITSDHFTVYAICWNFVRALQGAYAARLIRWNDMYSGELSLLCCVMCLLTQAASGEQLIKATGRANGATYAPLLAEAGEVLDAVITYKCGAAWREPRR